MTVPPVGVIKNHHMHAVRSNAVVWKRFSEIPRDAIRTASTKITERDLCNKIGMAVQPAGIVMNSDAHAVEAMQ
jgi:hypothetical protein